MISGELIGVKKSFTKFAKLITGESENDPLDRWLDEYKAIADSHIDMDMPTFVHLANAVPVFQGAGPAAAKILLWRARIETISGFSISPLTYV